MFDLAAGRVDRPFYEKRMAPAVMSMAAYGLAVGIGLFLAVFTISEELPEVPTLMAYVAEMPAPPPPPPPPAPPPPARAPQPKPPPPDVAGRFAAPIDVPEEITPETGIETGVSAGVVGGVEGGVPGGVVGGVVGGIPTSAPPPPPPPPPPMVPVRIGGDIREPEIVHRVEPEYPAMAVLAKATGMVILEALVDEHGVVRDVKVLRSRPMLDQAAIDAVRQWRYRPLMLNGQPQSFVLTVVVGFSFK